MKTSYILKSAVVFALTIMTLSLVSCKDDDSTNNNAGAVVDNTPMFIERFSTLLNRLVSLRENSVFGEKSGEYPASSKTILDGQISYLEEVIAKLTDGTKRLRDSEADRIIKNATQNERAFTATKRTEDFIALPAELFVNGRSGGYIDFGAHPEYSSFGESGKQKFTIDFWVRLKDIDGFIFLLSTFTDDPDTTPKFKGWAINSWFQNMRISYGMGNADIMEPAYGFNFVDEWVHLAFVTDETGVDGEMSAGRPTMVKIYLNGELKYSSASHHAEGKNYSPQTSNIPMIAFGVLFADGNRQEDKGCSGNMKHLHIWKSAKSQAEIGNIMSNPENVTGQESDLVCGWSFDKTVADNNDIKDLTGKYSAKLMGAYSWEEIK